MNYHKLKDKLRGKLTHFVEKVREDSTKLSEGLTLKKILQKSFYFFSVTIITLFTSGILLYLSVLGGLFGDIPTKEELKSLQNFTASEIYSSDGQLLGKYYIQDRTNVTYKEISPHIIKALIATEDARFYEHNGIDYVSWLRVFFKTLLLQDESSGGGSTISQQLAKNLFPRPNGGRFTMLKIKIKEAIIAQRLESVYTKEEILTLYLNTVPFGENAFGIETAASRFYSKKCEDITVDEAAVLIGMLKATYTYNPRLHPEKALQRRNVVLNQMVKYDYLTKEEYEQLKSKPITLKYRYHNHNQGKATYFREILRNELQQWAKENKKPDGSSYNIYTDGLKIYTTIDARMQTYAEEAVKEHLSELQKTFNTHWGSSAPWSSDSKILNDAVSNSKRYKQLKAKGVPEKEIQEIFKTPVSMKIFTWKGEEERMMSPLDSIKHYLMFLNAGFMAMEPSSGHVKAWVGGIDHKYFQYDHVNIKTKRQIGSTFKPLLYAAALETGIEPCEYIKNERRVYEDFDDWSPRNADGVYEGAYSMTGALISSVNTISVELLFQTGIDAVINTAKNLGVQSSIRPVPSIALGSANISLFEMVNSYATFANYGKVVKPVYLIRIEDKHGNVLGSWEKREPEKRAVSEETAHQMIYMLQQVINKGTGARLRYRYGLNGDIAGKTGTTQSHADGWFIGMTPKLVAGAWVGADDPRIHFRSLQLGQGANTALPIWGIFMKKVSKDPLLKVYTEGRFAPLPEELFEALDCEDYKEQLDEDKNSIFDFFRRLGKGDSEEEGESGEKVKEIKKDHKKATKEKKKGRFFDRVKGVFSKD